MSHMTKKHVLALAAGALLLATTAASAGPVRDSVRMSANPDGVRQVHYKTSQVKKQRVLRHQALRARVNTVGYRNPLGLPFAAAAGAGTVAGAVIGGAANTAGAVIGGTTGVLTGYPYDPIYGGYAYAGPGHGSYALVPEASFGLGVDRGHSFYNGLGAPAPASQDNCAVDGGYGRRDYAIGC